MSDFEINNDGNALRVDVFHRMKKVYVSVDDPENKCDRNNYEGEGAGEIERI